MVTYVLGVLVAVAAGIAAYRAVPWGAQVFAQRAQCRAGDLSAYGESDQYRFRAKARVRAIMRVLLVEGLLFIGWLRGGLPVELACAPWSLVAAALLEADLRSEYLPFELNALLLGGSIVVQGSLDCGAAVYGLAIGTVLFVIAGTFWMVGQRKGRQLLGGGDVVSILGVCAGSGYGCLTGALASCSFVVLVEGVRAAHANADGLRTFPLGPYLMIWLVVGFAC